MANSWGFTEAYEQLNNEQRAAVEAIEGPVFVIAGPGTGKTQVLTIRIANILAKTDTPPDAILALTFTESAAANMRERLAQLIGSAAWRVRIHTFHGFAESLISRYPDSFPRIIGAQVATDAERAELLDEAILTTEVKHLRPFGDPLYYHSAVARSISTMKRENVTPAKLLERIAQSEAEYEAIPGKFHEKGKYEGKLKGEYEGLKKKIEKTRDLHAVYEAYEAGLTARRRYDFEDIILEAVRALTEDEALRRMVQESLLYIHADEHQDANRAQNALLELLTEYHERPNLFIVGDEKQAIYRFQGADLDNVHYFRERYPDTTIIALVDNYRSTQNILDSALSLVAASPDERLSRVPLIAKAGHPLRPITLMTCDSPQQEIGALAENIHTLTKEEVAPGEIAVLVRRNRDVGEVARALVAHGIGVTAGGESDALRNRYTAALLRLLRAVHEPRDEHLGGVLTLPAFPLAAADVWRVMHAAKKERIPVFKLLTSPEKLADARVSDTASALALGAIIEKLARMATIERPAVVAGEALRDSGILPVILAAPDRAESLAAVRALLNLFDDLASREHDAQLGRALELVELYAERGMQLAGPVIEDETRVKVMTVHRAKGREFRYVFVPRLTESAWSTRSRPEHFHLPDILSGSAELEDERRLLYVAITRGKEHATLSYALSREDGRADSPSALVESLDPGLLEVTACTLATEDPLERERPLPSDRAQLAADDLATLRAAFLSQGLSPTALNNYLECPWKYFYVNLLRIPEAENKFMLFGTAIHTALKRYADERKQGKDIGTEGLIQAFTYALSRSPLTESEIRELGVKGERALTGWWEQRRDTWPEKTEAELGIEAYIVLEDEKLLLRGAIDRLDEVVGGYRVIDYKTGKARSRNEIMGATKDGDGNYYRQLAFYKLLLARTETPKVMTEGVIDFVEPDEKGRLRTEAFEIEDTELNELEELIRKTAGEILTLNFWNDPCTDEECSWCAVRFGR